MLGSCGDINDEGGANKGKHEREKKRSATNVPVGPSHKIVSRLSSDNT